MENIGNVLVSDILAHSGVKGMRWGVVKAAKSTPKSQARTDRKIMRGVTEKKFKTADKANLVLSTVYFGSVGNRIARKYGKRTINEIRSAKARGITAIETAKKP